MQRYYKSNVRQTKTAHFCSTMTLIFLKDTLISTIFDNFATKINLSNKINTLTMKRNIFALAAMALIASPLFMSCSNDPEMDSVPPSFKEVVIDPSSPAMGDTVTATVKFLSQGKKWYKLTYNWILSRSGQDSQYFVTNEETLIGEKEPSFQFVVPDTLGSYTLTVHMGIVQASSLFPGGTLSATTTIKDGTTSFNVTK